MSNNTNNRSPILANLVDSSIKSLREEQGLSLVLAKNSSRDDVSSNTSQSESDFKNSMVVAFEIQHNDIKRIATVPKGHKKIVSTSATNIGYFRGDGTATTKSNKPWIMTKDGLLVAIFGNDKKTMWQTEFYNSYGFKNDINFDNGVGYRQSADGWVYAVVGKMYDGLSSVSDGYIEIRNHHDDAKEFIYLNSIDEKSQAKRICSSGNEERTGNCCLYYKDYHYDSINGITYAPGHYYKCICAKCYHCLELAQALDMQYVFQPFLGASGGGLTGGTGERCLDCDNDNFPSDCGPCLCKINSPPDTVRILGNNDLPPSGTANQNAIYANWWKTNGEGSVFIHLTKAFSDTPSIERKISNNWFGRNDKNIKLIGSQDSGKTNTIYSLEVVGKKGEAYITGIRWRYTGQYSDIPQIDMTELRKICPTAQPDWFNIIRVPDLHEEIHQLVGATQVMIRKQIAFQEIADLTDVSTFDGYGIVILSTQDGGKYFNHGSKVAGKARLTIKNDMRTTNSSGGLPVGRQGLSLDGQTQFKELNVSLTKNKESSIVKAIQSDAGVDSYVVLANINTITTSKVIAEIFSGNKDTKTKENLKFVDNSTGNIYTTINSDVSTDPTTGEKLDAGATKIFNQNKTTINIPDQSRLGGGINSQSMTIELVLGTGAPTFK